MSPCCVIHRPAFRAVATVSTPGSPGGSCCPNSIESPCSTESEPRLTARNFVKSEILKQRRVQFGCEISALLATDANFLVASAAGKRQERSDTHWPGQDRLIMRRPPSRLPLQRPSAGNLGRCNETSGECGRTRANARPLRAGHECSRGSRPLCSRCHRLRHN